MDPPILTKGISYEQWKLETLAWTKITDLSRAKQAVAVALLLPKDHEMRIAEKVFEQLELDRLTVENGISILFDFLDKHLRKDELIDTLDKFEDFENFERKEGQSIYEYVSMFDFKYSKIERKNVKLPSEILAFRLLRKANIPKIEYLLVLTGMNFESKSTLFEDAKMMLKKLKGNDRQINSSSRNVNLTPAFLAEIEEAPFSTGYIRGAGKGARNQCVDRSKGEFWNSGPRSYDRVGGNQIKGASSMGMKYGLKKKVNPTGSDGRIILCHSCGSFRHLLDDCPDSWENMEKKNASADTGPYGQLNHGDKEKITSDDRLGPVQVGGDKAIESERECNTAETLRKLTSQVENLKREIKDFREEIQEVKTGDNRHMNALSEKHNELENLLSSKQRTPSVADSIEQCRHQNELGATYMKTLMGICRELDSTIKVRDAAAKNTDENQTVWGSVRSHIDGKRKEDTGIGGMRLSTMDLIADRARQMQQTIRKLLGIRDNRDQMKICFEEGMNMTIHTAMIYQQLKLLQSDLCL